MPMHELRGEDLQEVAVEHLAKRLPETKVLLSHGMYEVNELLHEDRHAEVLLRVDLTEVCQ